MGETDDVCMLTPVEIASEELIGSMQNVCDAVEHWLDVQVEEIEMAPVELAEMQLRAVFDAYCARRDALREMSEREANALGL